MNYQQLYEVAMVSNSDLARVIIFLAVMLATSTAGIVSLFLIYLRQKAQIKQLKTLGIGELRKPEASLSLRQLQEAANQLQQLVPSLTLQQAASFIWGLAGSWNLPTTVLAEVEQKYFDWRQAEDFYCRLEAGARQALIAATTDIDRQKAGDALSRARDLKRQLRRGRNRLVSLQQAISTH